MTRAETLAMEGTGWEGDLDEMRQSRVLDRDAADLYRVCRRRGETVRRLNDCLVAAVAIRDQVPVLHHDRDFEVLARHTPLALAH